MGIALLEYLSKLRVLAVTLTTLAVIAPLDNPHKIEYDGPLLHEYDFIVVGAGSGGAVMASRLSETRRDHVLLLEAGEDGTGLTEIPVLTALVYGTPSYDWGFRSQRDPRSCRGFKSGVCVLPRGRMLGGSSAVNGVMYVRGNRNDYDQWRRLGNTGWGYDDVLPYFIRAEDNQDPHLSGSPFHGVGGPLAVSGPRFLTDLAHVWLQAGQYLGYPVGDINGAKQSRFMLHQTTTKNGKRWSTAKGYLRHASRRHNLNIQVRAEVTRVIIDPRTLRARGVVFFKGGRRHVAWARKEVVLSAGAFKTPQLLKLSGVGPCEELRHHQIPCLHDLPGVGENMQSHFATGGAEFLTDKGHGLGIWDFLNPLTLPKYLLKRRGPLASSMIVEGTAFVNSPLNNVSYGADWPDVQLIFYPVNLASDGGIIFRDFLGLTNKLWRQFAPNKFKAGFRVAAIHLRPSSRGRVLLRSRNPWHHPVIQLNTLDHPRDLAVMREAALIADQVGLSPPFRRVGARPNPVPSPFCGHLPDRSPTWWECQTRVFTETILHDTSTCAMGPPDDHYAVVDNQLRVYGIRGLRIVDASVMPRIVSGNTNAPTIMIAEKAADLVRAYWHAVDLGYDPASFVEQHVLHPHRRSGRLYDFTEHVAAHERVARADPRAEREEERGGVRAEPSDPVNVQADRNATTGRSASSLSHNGREPAVASPAEVVRLSEGQSQSYVSSGRVRRSPAVERQLRFIQNWPLSGKGGNTSEAVPSGVTSSPAGDVGGYAGGDAESAEAVTAPGQAPLDDAGLSEEDRRSLLLAWTDDDVVSEEPVGEDGGRLPAQDLMRRAREKLVMLVREMGRSWLKW